MKGMKNWRPTGTAAVAKLAVAVLSLAAATGAAFAAWIDQGAGIFLATVDAGLSWCF
ncbi:MAG: hypothetical protein JNL61_22320 [Rhizobiaceae bacterium]|nr:hypothetical protein [Rhizobiaceae bacterium]